MNAKIRIGSLGDMEKFARAVANSILGGETLALSGELGAGKTAFTQALARALGIGEVVQSPTFLLMKCYETNLKVKSSKLKVLCHVDAYRIKSERELLNIGLSEKISDPETVTVIEWADRIEGLIPENALRFRFAYGKNPDERIVFF